MLLAPDRAHPAGLAALRRAGGRILEPGPEARTALTRADLVLDGIIGISGRGALREPAAELVEVVARAGVPVLAVDLPSGVDPDTGAVDGPAVTATETVTFGAFKPVHVLAAARCGPVHLVDIGLAPLLPEPHLSVLEAADVAARWPVPGPADDKYTQGVSGIAAGSATYPGAAVLATGAAVLATSGMVRFAGGAAPGVRDHWPEVVTTEDVAAAGHTQAWAVGPGIGTDDGRAGDARRRARAGRPYLHRRRRDHLARPARGAAPGGERATDPAHPARPGVRPGRRAGRPGPGGAARRAAAELGATVLLKGNATVVADPDGRVAGAPVDHLVGGHRRLRRRADRDHRRAAGRRAGALVGRRLRHLRARPGRGTGRAGAPAPASRILAAIPQAIRDLRA